MRTSRAAYALALSVFLSAGASGQSPGLRIERADGTAVPVETTLDHGYAALAVSTFEQLGWVAVASGEVVTVTLRNEIELRLTIGSPFFSWDGLVLQLADPPYSTGGQTFVPVQLLTDFLPRRLPDLYEFDGARSVLRAGDPDGPGETAAAAGAGSPDEGGGPDPSAGAALSDLPEGPSPYEGPRVVVIDAGHGGADPGALGPGGVREKDVALGIALELAKILDGEPNLEVHMTRDRDTFVDLWQRGEIATDFKGDRPGLFVSIHANSFPNSRATRGYETYFLSEARTEHERRVSAIENAPLTFQGQDVDAAAEPDLDFILRELRNLDHQHWSALLADFVQTELDDFHPGPNRGVKQGVLAVLTNALMPAILVETGYLSNDDEGRLLGEHSFQRQTAEGVARAVLRFFERYPPENGIGGSQEEG